MRYPLHQSSAQSPWHMRKMSECVTSGPATSMSTSLPCALLSRSSRVQLFATPWTGALQALLSMGFSRKDYWSGLPFPSAGDLPHPVSEPGSPTLQADSFFFPFIFISWRLITLQYRSGFCHTLTWISHGFACNPHPDPPSHLLHLIPLGLPSAPAPSTCLMHPIWAGELFHPR